MGEIYGYARVSSAVQNEDRQIEALLKNGVQKDNIFVDKKSGKDFERLGYKNMISKLKEGDVVIVESLDRLGRNYEELRVQWSKITCEMKSDICVIDMPLIDTRYKKDLLGRFIADLVIQILSYAAQSEREHIRQRQAEGIAIAKSKGVKVGRPLKCDNKEFEEICNRLLTGEITVSEAAIVLNVSTDTVYRKIREIKRGVA